MECDIDLVLDNECNNALMLYSAVDRTVVPLSRYYPDLSCHHVLTNTMELCNDFFYGIQFNH
jgi:hypothetical protein